MIFSRAHPHVCGEHIYRVACYRIIAGSSPRMRGTHSHGKGETMPGGLIPTYAGNTVLPGVVGGVVRAHPHVCGEHKHRPKRRYRHPGSSPRMRGTLGCDTGQYQFCGLIPTYAGNTNHVRMDILKFRAHPHVCGEHPRRGLPAKSAMGSSPRMRGTHIYFLILEHERGLIPTYAGNTTQMVTTSPRTRAHPHVCGEHTQPRFA